MLQRLFFFSYFPVFFHRSSVNLMIVLLCIFINAFHFNSNMLYKKYIYTNFFIFLNFIYFMDKDEIRGKNLYSFKFGLLCDVTFYIQYFKNILVLQEDYENDQKKRRRNQNSHYLETYLVGGMLTTANLSANRKISNLFNRSGELESTFETVHI